MSDARVLRIRWRVLAVIAILALAGAARAQGQSSGRAVVTGTVQVDAGKVLGLMVRARDIDRRITYSVFTRHGRYRIPDLKPGRYEIRVAEERHFESPVRRLELSSGQRIEVDFALRAKPGFDPAEQFRPRDPHFVEIDYSLPLVEYDELYPPGEGRLALEVNCMPCHGTTFHHMEQNREGWRASVGRMTTMRTGHVPIYSAMSEETKELIVDYLSTHFAPGREMKDVRLDELRVEEHEVADALYIEYELPPPEQGRRRIHDPYIGPGGSVWFGDTGAGSVFQLDPDADDFEKRIRREHVSPNPRAFVHGIAIDGEGVVYYGDINGGYVGEVNPASGEWVMHETINNGSVLQLVPDSHDNILFNIVHGDGVGMIDAATRDVDLWRIPTPDSNLYGLVVDSRDKVWSAASAKHLLLYFDPATGEFREYPLRPLPSGPRRLCVDDRDRVWWPEYVGGDLGRLDPRSGEMVELPFPLKLTAGYDCLQVGEHIWITDAMYQAIIRFDPKSREFVYYPLPRIQPSFNPGVPKIEVDPQGTIWFGYRGLENNQVVAFKPRGNAEPIAE